MLGQLHILALLCCLQAREVFKARAFQCQPLKANLIQLLFCVTMLWLLFCVANHACQHWQIEAWQTSDLQPCGQHSNHRARHHSVVKHHVVQISRRCLSAVIAVNLSQAVNRKIAQACRAWHQQSSNRT